METPTNGVQVTDFQDRFLFSLSQLSSAFGPARETISKRLQQANVVPQAQRKGHDVYHIGQAAPAILATGPSSKEIEDPETLPPKDRLDYYKGNNERRKGLVEDGLLIPVANHTEGLAKMAKILVREFDNLPDELELKCGLSPGELEVIEQHCDDARRRIAKELAD